MKKLLFIAVAMLVVFASCKDENKTQKWEYMRVVLHPSVDSYDENYGFYNGEHLSRKGHENDTLNSSRLLVDSLNILGQEGWEIVGTYNMTSTTFPNFGDTKFVTGIRDQVATREVSILLKRPYVESDKKEEKTDSAAKK